MRRLLVPLIVASVWAVSATAADDHDLTATIKGRDGLCLRDVPQPPLGRKTTAGDRFQLRAPGRKPNIPYGRVLVQAQGLTTTDHGCVIVLHFKITPSLGMFYVFDASNGGLWGPYDSKNLPTYGWQLLLVEEGAVSTLAPVERADGEWYGKIVSVSVSRRTLMFAPACRGSATVPVSERGAESLLIAHADLEIYYRPGGKVVGGHVQAASLKLLASVAAHGRLPDFPPGWFVTVKGGAVISVREDRACARCPTGVFRAALLVPS